MFHISIGIPVAIVILLLLRVLLSSPLSLLLLSSNFLVVFFRCSAFYCKYLVVAAAAVGEDFNPTESEEDVRGSWREQLLTCLWGQSQVPTIQTIHHSTRHETRQHSSSVKLRQQARQSRSITFTQSPMLLCCTGYIMLAKTACSIVWCP